MKKIKFSIIYPGDETSTYTNVKKMTIFLGPGKLFLFTDMKKVNRFLAETNRFINIRLFGLNSGYIKIFKEFRDLWFDLSSTDTRIVRNLFDSIDYEFELLIPRANNQNVLILKKIKSIYLILINVANILKFKASKMNTMHTFHIIDISINNFDSEIQSIDDYGLDSELRHLGPVGLRNPNGIYTDE